MRSLVDELLKFLDTADAEFKQYMTSELFLVTERFSPDRAWQIETVISFVRKVWPSSIILRVCDPYCVW